MLAQLDLLRHWNESTAFKNDVYLLPTQLDEPVVAYQLPALDEVLTVFAQERADHVVVTVEGPFKGVNRYLPRQVSTAQVTRFKGPDFKNKCGVWPPVRR